MLNGRAGVALTLFVFDVLAVEGVVTTLQPYSERRTLLEQLDLENQRVRLVATFKDGEALFALSALVGSRRGQKPSVAPPKAKERWRRAKFSASRIT